MKTIFRILFLLFFCHLKAQNKPLETVYFEFDKSDLYNDQIKTIIDFAKNADTSKIESIQIYGYCDDRGEKDYNYKLSKNRVKTVEDILIYNGFNKNKIVIIEGKGRVIIQPDSIDNLTEIRNKNRRVDLFVVKKNSYGKGIYNSFQENHKVGDRIFLENIFFALGKSELTLQSRKELDKMALLLQKHPTLQFEIRGYVCCTPDFFDDAIDEGTHERKLSLNRARNVFKYLVLKNINSLRMSFKGCGNKFPLGKGEVLDRRVEFLVLKI